MQEAARTRNYQMESVGNFTPCTVGSHASTQSTYGRRRGTVTGDSHVDVSVVALKLQTSLSALRKVRTQLRDESHASRSATD